jgi:anti-sigma B factor antagonist
MGRKPDTEAGFRPIGSGVLRRRNGRGRGETPTRAAALRLPSLGIHRFVTTFRVTERDVGPSRHPVIQIHGELGLPEVDELQKTLAAAASRREEVVVGLENCEFVDSLALAALLRARDRMAADGGRLVIAGPTGQVRRIIEISGLDLDGFFFDSVDQALGDG